MKITLKIVEGPHTGKQFEFEHHDTFIVGRGRHATFQLSQEDRFFSRNHFLVEINPPMCRLVDLNSSNGTFVNGERTKTIDLAHGDLIRGGDTTMQVAIEQMSLPKANEVPASVPKVQRTLEPEHGKFPTVTITGQLPDAVESIAPTAPMDRNRIPAINRAHTIENSGEFPQFPGYRTVRVLGRGGMGIVYEAQSIHDQSRVAIKVIAPNVEATSKDLSRFIREASILQDLQHPNIVRYLEMGQTEGSLYIVMEFIDGVPAVDLVRSDGRELPVERAVNLTIQLLTALSYAHEKGYVHRDVKPANLLVAQKEKQDFVYLADFGLARTFQSSKLSGLTMTGDVGGTTPFMPPEQVTNYRQVSPAADQYSSAATLYSLLTQKFIYDFPKEVSKQLLMVLQEEPVPIERRRSDLPRKLVEVIHKALSRNPSARFADTTAFQAALQSAIA